MDWGKTWIIGGGPSAGPIDTARFKGRGVVLGVNDAAFQKCCDAFFTNDHGYALGIRDKIEAFPGERHLAIRQRFLHRFEGWQATIWHRVDECEPATRPGRLSSGPAGTPGCSGYVALNLAAQMGAKQIVLFGYDFADDYRYFFDDQPFPRVHVPGVRASFRDVAPWYAARGIEVFNANPGSSIEGFPKITHQEAFDLA